MFLDVNTQPVIIFIPDTLQSEIGYLEGTIAHDTNQCSVYITNDRVSSIQSFRCIGYSSENSPSSNPNGFDKQLGTNGWVHLNCLSGDAKLIDSDSPEGLDVLKIIYDYDAFVKSDLLKSIHLEGHIEVLSRKIKLHRKFTKLKKQHSTLVYIILSILSFILKILDKFENVIKYSATASHFKSTVVAFRWALNKQHITLLKLNNFIVAKLVDLSIGFVILYYYLQYEKCILDFVQASTEIIIDSLKDLLSILMGSPAGLKLNYAFNKTLGTFFFYHISLWRAFLQSMNPSLRVTLRLMVLPGLLGLTFQAALFEDLIAFVTFHVYCIYVYAARLYGLQIKGLVSLWRLFIGRKYNPLRERVDSYQYSHHQLFIGTLGFTIILFLLPTTLLYYMVFMTLRLAILILNGALLRLRYALQYFPLYVMALWVCNSASVAGSVRFSFKQFEQRGLYCTLTSLPLATVVNSSLPETLPPLPHVSWGKICHSMFTGVLL